MTNQTLKHTEEPWEIDQERTNALNRDAFIISAPETAENTRIAYCYDEPHMAGGSEWEAKGNAQRIVAMSKVCTGISTEALERLGLGGMDALADRLVYLTECLSHQYPDSATILHETWQLIAKVKG